MSAVSSLLNSSLATVLRWLGVRSVALEVTQDCNQDCLYCYNVWKNHTYPKGFVDTPRTLNLIDRIISGYHPGVITFTGGEPLLRPDIVELVSHVSRRAYCTIATNGTRLTDDLASDLIKAGIRTFEFTLLSADRDVHNTLVGRESFDQVIEAIAAVRYLGGYVATTFVATKQNVGGWREMLDLNAALGVNGLLFNRFNVGGAGVHSVDDLMPTIEQLDQALSAADQAVKRYGIDISCGVPIPPCVLDRTKYPNVRFTDCPAGTSRAYPTVDSEGNVRMCNHSPAILGNLFTTNFDQIVQSVAWREQFGQIPSDCIGCKHVKTCRGGCRAAAEACGNSCGIDPFVTFSTGRGQTSCDI